MKRSNKFPVVSNNYSPRSPVQADLAKLNKDPERQAAVKKAKDVILKNKKEKLYLLGEYRSYKGLAQILCKSLKNMPAIDAEKIEVSIKDTNNYFFGVVLNKKPSIKNLEAIRNYMNGVFECYVQMNAILEI